MPKPRYKVFVTVGTTSFSDLISAIMDPNCLAALHANNYGIIKIQHGDYPAYEAADTPAFKKACWDMNMRVTGYGYADSEVIRQDFVDCDLVICHAGSGSILEALRYQKRIIVVPNETLMDNHQVELAEEMHRQKYVIHSGIPDLPNAIQKSVDFKYKHFPRTGSKKFAEILEEELETADADTMYG